MKISVWGNLAKVRIPSSSPRLTQMMQAPRWGESPPGSPGELQLCHRWDMNFAKLKRYIQMSLGQLGVYERAKASFVYDFYWRVVDRRVIDERRAELDFYRGLLD